VISCEKWLVYLELFALLLESGAGVGAVKELGDVIQSTHFCVSSATMFLSLPLLLLVTLLFIAINHHDLKPSKYPKQ